MSELSGAAAPAAEKVAWGRYLWVAPLAIVAAVAANVLIRTAAKALFNVPDQFGPFRPSNFVSLTVMGTLGAVLVFGLVGWLSKRPFRTFNRIAGVVLVLTWVPDILLLIGRPFPGVSVLSVGTLMGMHAVAAGIVVWMLNNLAKVK